MEDAIGDRPPTVPGEEGAAAAWCGRCGGSLGEDDGGHDHAACVAALALEPPRYCRHCRRRMKVQVTPTGWTARCAAHGDLDSSGIAGDAR